MNNTKIYLEPNYLEETINGLQQMCDNVRVLYDAHAKGNTKLTKMANFAYYLLWNYLKSLIALKLLLSATTQSEQDFAKGQLCVTINECIKRVIGFEAKKGTQREECFWIQEMGIFISTHQQYSEQYYALKKEWIRYANSFDGNIDLKDMRDIATHGDKKIENLIKLHTLPVSNVVHYLDEWGKIMLPTAHFTFTCFENECQQVMDNKFKSNML